MVRRSVRRRAVWLMVLTLLIGVLAGCGGQSGGGATTGSSGGATPGTGAAASSGGGQKVIVFAASSLLEPFQELAQVFQQSHAGTTVEFNFAGSAQLVAQLQQGAPVDVIAFADLINMKKAQDGGFVANDPTIFAKNRLTVVVPKQNRAGIQSFADLAKPGVKVVLAHENVPVGKYAREVLERASQQPGYGPDFAQRVLANVVSQEVNVKQVLAKVALGEADAGIVYVTDVKAAGADVLSIDIPSDVNVIACYPIAVVKGTKAPELAQAFVTLVESEEGRAVLQKHGFEPVEPGQAGTEGCS